MKAKLTTKLVAVFLVLVLCLAVMPISTVAAKSTDVRAIPGIDYDRITQKATAGIKGYPVELQLGDLTFNGELVGSLGLTIEELNAIIYAVLAEMGLDVDRVALVSELAKHLGVDAIKYWGDQMIEGLLSFIPSWPGYGINDYYNYIVHGEGKDDAAIGNDLILDKYVGDAEDALKGGGKVAKAVGKAGTLGPIVNTIKVGKEWLMGSKRFEQYLKQIEEALAEVSAFYSECSRRANKLAEEKGEEYAWQIRFDKTKNYRTYNATFWGVSGITMQAELSGVLEKVGNDDDVTGEYKGTLWLDVEAVDMESEFDSKFAQVYPYSLLLSTMQSTIPSAKDVYKETVLTRQMQGEVTVTITGSSGTQTAKIEGSLTSDMDETTFDFDHNLMGKDVEQIGTVTRTQHNSHHYTSNSLETLTQVDTFYIESVSTVMGYTSTEIVGSKTPTAPQTGKVPGGAGTLWKPFEGSPSMKINFRK